MSVESLLELAKKVLKAKTGSIEQLILYQNFQADVQPIYSIPILEEHIRLQGLGKEARDILEEVSEVCLCECRTIIDAKIICPKCLASDFLKKVSPSKLEQEVKE